MTQDEIIRMAREAELWGCEMAIGGEKELERFAALVAAHEREKLLKDMLKDNPFLAEQLQAYINLAVAAEREACAKVCDDRVTAYQYATDPWAHEHISEANTCAAAIRARSEK